VSIENELIPSASHFKEPPPPPEQFKSKLESFDFLPEEIKQKLYGLYLKLYKTSNPSKLLKRIQI